MPKPTKTNAATFKFWGHDGLSMQGSGDLSFACEYAFRMLPPDQRIKILNLFNKITAAAGNLIDNPRKEG